MTRVSDNSVTVPAHRALLDQVMTVTEQYVTGVGVCATGLMTLLMMASGVIRRGSAKDCNGGAVVTGFLLATAGAGMAGNAYRHLVHDFDCSKDNCKESLGRHLVAHPEIQELRVTLADHGGTILGKCAIETIRKTYVSEGPTWTWKVERLGIDSGSLEDFSIENCH